MTQQIADSLGVVETVNGTEIHATRDGKFAAVVNGARIELASKAQLAKRILGNQAPIKCLDCGSDYPVAHEVLRVTRARRVVYLRPKYYNQGVMEETAEPEGGWYFYDADAERELTEIAERSAELRRRRTEILGRLSRVTAESFARAQTELAANAADAE